MSTKRTIHRREARKRARANKAERTRIWNALSPEERQRRESIIRWYKDIYEDAIKQRLEEMARWEQCCGIYDLKRG